jgi:hypothetical protein
VAPAAEILTELVRYDSEEAVVKATVTVPGGGSDSDFGSETPGDFGDYLEKASTKAIGRALAGLGFGTQFCPDFDFGADRGKVVDSPVGGGQRRVDQSAARASSGVASLGQAITERQITFLGAVARDAGMSDADVADLIQTTYGRTLLELSRREASSLIERLQDKRAAGIAS